MPQRLPLKVSCLLLLMLSACKASFSTPAGSSQVSATPLRLPVVHVQSSNLPTIVTIPGNVNALPNESVKVSPTVAGTIIAIPVAPGQRVQRGQVIAELDTRQSKAQLNQATAALKAAEENVAQAKANLQLANSDFERYRTLYQSGAISQQTFATYKNKASVAQSQLNAAMAQAQQARASRSQAQNQLQYDIVHSPISGIVASRLLQVGDSAAGAGASPSTPIVEIVNLDTILVNANLPADKPANIRVGENAQIRSVALPGVTFDGTVTAISPVVDPKSNTLSIKIRTPNPGDKLKVGQVVSVSITTSVHKGALTVPQTALVPDPNNSQEKVVYTIQAGKAKPVQVKTGIQQDGQVEILSGLQLGEAVVAQGAYGVPAGTAVKAVTEAKK